MLLLLTSHWRLTEKWEQILHATEPTTEEKYKAKDAFVVEIERPGVYLAGVVTYGGSWGYP